ncbi:TetR/AcrR family transcriptional regulator [Agrobacterium tumefaciens]|nr:TetR/AcrR family transcriptional regulator [Agrobacterium tumefaciens]NTE18107.1 TetR/AcrR family transcriptional regulator [Agrobacterium tumefaciens]
MAKKRYQGTSNDKERSTQKLIEAVGIIIKTKGYTGLTATNISKAAGLSRRLITIYFESVESLIETYIRNKNYWAEASSYVNETIGKNQGTNTRQLLDILLQNQLDHFYEDDEMQKIVLWQISQRNQIIHEISEDRERFSSSFFKLSDKELYVKDIDLRAVTSLLMAGIYYMVLHAKSTDSLFCEIDINKPEGMTRIKKAISLILEKTYDKA